jgi:hypothetical protein
MDTRTSRALDSSRLAAGFAKDIRNWTVDPTGCLVTRDGFEGQFTTPLAGPIFEPTAFETTDGGTWIVFAAGGKLYKTLAGSPSYSEITNGGPSFAFPDGGRSVRMVRYGRYIYGVPGAGGGPLFRTDLMSGESIVGLTTPTTAPTARLSGETLDATGDATKWSGQGDPTSTTQLVLNASFEDGTGDSDQITNLDDWTEIGTADAVNASNSNRAVPLNGSWALLLNEADNAVQQSIASLPGLNGSPPAGVAQKARVYGVQAAFHSNDPSGQSAITVLVQALDSGGNEIDRDLRTFQYPRHTARNLWTTERWAAAFNGLSADPASLRVTLTAGANNGDGDLSAYCDYIHISPLKHGLVATAGATAGTLAVAVRAADPNHADNPNTEGLRATAGLWIRRTFAGSGGDPYANLSSVYTVSIPLTWADAILAESGRPRLRLGIQENGSSTIHWTNTGQYSEDGTAVGFDLTTIASDSRNSVQYLYLQLLDDMPTADASGALFSFGPIRDAGALSAGYAYNWRFSEYDSVSGSYPTGDGVESSGSPLSNTVVASLTEARGVVTLPAQTNPGTTHFLIWRAGGVFATEDSYSRFIAVVPVDSSPSGVGWSWDHSNRVFTDNVPDSALFDADIYQVGRDPMPSGATGIAVHQARLWVAVGNRIYASWLLSEGRESGLYTTLLDDPTDPGRSIKGALLALSSNEDADTIAALIPFGTNLIAPRRNSVSVISGYEPGNFAAQSYLASAGVGCKAFRATGLSMTPAGLNEAWFLSDGGVMAFDGDALAPRSMALEGRLASRFFSAAAYAKAAQVLHDRQLWLFAPMADGDSDNTGIYLWDSRVRGGERLLVGGWTRHDSAVVSGFTGGVSLAGGGDAGELYLAGLDGQLYRYTGMADKATPNGATQGIVQVWESRGYGDGTGEETRAIELWMRVRYYEPQYEGTLPLTITATGSRSVGGVDNSGAGHSKVFTVASGERSLRSRVGAWVRGDDVTLKVEATTKARLILREGALDFATGTRARR